MKEPLARGLRSTRIGLFKALSPLDYVYRLIEDKKNFPPLWLRAHVGALRDFEGSGGEYATYLKLLCNLKPGNRLLDIGCGCGLMTLNLTGPDTLPSYLGHQGQYVGMDIYKPAVEWAQEHITTKYPNCVFLHIDIRVEEYNPKGRWTAEEFPFPFGAQAWDVILLKSVFTHLLVGEARWYLSRIERLLKPEGVCLSTWFLLNDEQHDLQYKGLSHLNFNPISVNGHTAYLRNTRPRLGVGYNEELLRIVIGQEGLVPEIKYGTWSGRSDGLSFQDIILLRRQ